MNTSKYNTEPKEKGYALIQDFYSENTINQILKIIENTGDYTDVFSKTKDVFAIRQLLKTYPQLTELLFNKKLVQFISQLYNAAYFLTKAIYFDKPSHSNWFVPFHQDLSISVNEKTNLENYCNWTYKTGIYGVQPPVEILNDTITVRIHLDDTTKNNGALRVIPKSHLKGVIRKDSEYWNLENETICNIKKGGIMLMKPLTLHASNRTTNNKRRRVIHLEFNKHQLAKPLHWLEYLDIKDKIA